MEWLIWYDIILTDPLVYHRRLAQKLWPVYFGIGNFDTSEDKISEKVLAAPSELEINIFEIMSLLF